MGECGGEGEWGSVGVRGRGGRGRGRGSGGGGRFFINHRI